jgi:hypothetical protein
LDFCEFRARIAKALGIQIGRESWWDTSDDAKERVLLDRIAKLKRKKVP